MVGVNLVDLGPIAQLRAGRLGRRLPQLYVGLVAYGVSLALMYRGDLGLAPWDVLHSGLIQHLPITIRKATSDGEQARLLDGELEALDVVAKRFERDYLLRVLRSVAGNRGRAAEVLGLSRKGLWGKLKAHGISDDDIEQDEPV